MWCCVLLLVLGSLDAGAEGAGSAVDLISRAEVEVAAARPGDEAAERAALLRAEGWLRGARARGGLSFEGTLLWGQVLLRLGRAQEAVEQLARPCAQPQTARQDVLCSLHVAAARAQAGQFEAALAGYARASADKQRGPWLQVKSAEVLVALGRLPEAEARLGSAIAALEARAAGPDRDARLAFALYALAAAQDRGGAEAAARTTMSRAIAYDGKLALLDLAGDPCSGQGFVPAVEVDYVRALALLVLGREREAMWAWGQYVERRPRPRWRERAEVHLLELAVAGAEQAPTRRRRARISAAATVESKGPVPAPLIDAAWRLRPRLIEPCLEMLPDSAPSSLRVSVLLEINARGAITRASVQLPQYVGFGASSDWQDFTSCVARRVKSGLRLARPARPRTTSARVEVVLAIPESS